MHDSPYLIADIGNSRAKFKLSNEYFALNYSPYFSTEIKRLITLDNLPAVCYYSSVNKYALFELKNIFKSTRFIPATDLLTLQSPIGNIGSDRIFGIYGAICKYKKPLITIDCGTAVTINYIDRHLTFRGGAIFAGAYTQMQSLNRATSMKNFHFDSNSLFPSLETSSSLNYGIFSSIQGAVRQVINDIMEIKYIVITGGYGQLLHDSLIEHYDNCHYEIDLILSGIEYAINNKCVFKKADFEQNI